MCVCLAVRVVSRTDEQRCTFWCRKRVHYISFFSILVILDVHCDLELQMSHKEPIQVLHCYMQM